MHCVDCVRRDPSAFERRRRLRRRRQRRRRQNVIDPLERTRTNVGCRTASGSGALHMHTLKRPGSPCVVTRLQTYTECESIVCVRASLANTGENRVFAEHRVLSILCMRVRVCGGHETSMRRTSASTTGRISFRWAVRVCLKCDDKVACACARARNTCVAASEQELYIENLLTMCACARIIVREEQSHEQTCAHYSLNVRHLRLVGLVALPTFHSPPHTHTHRRTDREPTRNGRSPSLPLRFGLHLTRPGESSCPPRTPPVRLANRSKSLADHSSNAAAGRGELR